MQSIFRLVFVATQRWTLLGLLGVVACAAPSLRTAAVPRECPGSIVVPEGIEPAENEVLLRSVLGAPGEGKLCAGRVFVVRRPVRVFRLWSREQAHTQWGRWWTFDEPTASVSELRSRYAICPEWSPLNALSVCRLRVGTTIVVGPGQSVSCANGLNFTASSALQVYVPNNTRVQPPELFVDECSALQPPAAN